MPPPPPSTSLTTAPPPTPSATAPPPVARPDAFYVTTKFGAKAIVVNNYLFYKIKTTMNSDVTYWRCAQFQKSKCKCKVKTIGADVYLDSTAHNHEETEEMKKEIMLMQLRLDLKT